jgi:hypothetical protein
LEVDDAGRYHIGQIAAYVRQVARQLDARDIGAPIEAIVGARDGGDARGRFGENLADIRIALRRGPQVEHAADELQAVLDAMVDLLDQHLLVLERDLESVLMALPLDGHADEVGRSLQESDVLLRKIAFRPAVGLQHAEGRAVALQDHVDGAAHAMYGEQLGRAEAFLVLELVGNDGLAGAQGKSRRRLQVGPDRGRTDQAGIPAHAGAQQETVLGRPVFEHLAELGFQALRGQADRLGQQPFQWHAPQRHHPKLGQDLLLPNAHMHVALTGSGF